MSFQWTELPASFQDRVTGKLDFLTRTRLSQTCHAERKRFNLEQHELEYLMVFGEANSMLTVIVKEKGHEEEFEFRITNADWSQNQKNMVKVLFEKSSSIEHLTLDTCPEELLRNVTKHCLNITKLTCMDLTGCCEKEVIARCDESKLLTFETFSVKSASFQFNLLTPEFVKRVEVINIHNLTQFGIPAVIACKWIEHDVGVGKKLQFSTKSPLVEEFFKFQFGEGMTESHDNGCIILKMKCSDKKIAIIMEQKLEETYFYVMRVLPGNIHSAEIAEWLQPDLDLLTSNGIW